MIFGDLEGIFVKFSYMWDFFRVLYIKILVLRKIYIRILIYITKKNNTANELKHKKQKSRLFVE